MKKTTLVFLCVCMLLVLLAGIFQPALCTPAEFSRLSTEDIAKTYLGKRWVANPLAENSTNGVDCTTYVEEVLAERYDNPDMVLNYIRYRDGIAGFFNRNHFMEEMWIPNAQKYGIIAPIALPDTSNSLMKVNLAEWYRVNPEIISKDAAYYREADVQGQFTASIPYIQSGRIDEQFLKTLPEETVVFFLRRYPKPPYQWLLNENAVMVTHMGFLFDGQRLYHASSRQKQVISEDFSGYLLANPGICGVMFYKMHITLPQND